MVRNRQSQDPQPRWSSRMHISEDWVATIVGLILVALAFAGVITKAMVP